MLEDDSQSADVFCTSSVPVSPRLFLGSLVDAEPLAKDTIVEKFTEMEEDLSKERKTMTRLWAKREEQIRGVISSTAGMYGDLQGNAGKGLNEIEGLEIAMLPSEITQN